MAGFGFGLLVGHALVFVMVRALIEQPFLIGVPVFEVRWPLAEFIQIVLTLVVGTGLTIELPAFLTALVWLGIVSRERLASWRKCALIMAFLIAALVTPTPDITNQILVAAPLYLMYELGLLLARPVPTEDSGQKHR